MHIDTETDTFVVDDRHRYPLEVVDFGDTDATEWFWRRRRGLMRFESGATLSIIYGDATWSTNRDCFLNDYLFNERPTCVEVWASWEEEPRGYVDKEGLLLLIAQANIQPTDQPTQGDKP
jgi:hypothetical protein